MNEEELKEYEKSELYRVCNELASVTTSKRQELLDYLRKYGNKKFLDKYEV